MNRSLLLLLIGFALGGMTGIVAGIGFDSPSRERDMSGHEMPGGAAMEGSDHQGHDHSEILSLPGGADAPTLSVSIHEDPGSGWNLHIETDNFVFSPQNASSDHVDGEGHAHVYVNGEKFARVYGAWTHLPALNPGHNEIEVTLNSNDHRMLAVDGEPLTAIVMVHRD